MYPIILNTNQPAFTKFPSILKDGAAIPLFGAVHVTLDHAPNLHTKILATSFAIRPCTFVHT